MDQTNKPIASMIMPLENRREAILELAITAERTGYNAVYLTESWSYDTTLILTEIATLTKKIALGSAVLSIWGRSPGTFAMAAASLNSISGGRFNLGLGSSSKQLTEGFHDVVYQKPYKKIRQIVEQTRALLQGERIPLENSKEAGPLKLNLNNVGEIPILLAASSDKTIDLAWELCDGWLPFLYPKDKLKEVVSNFSERDKKTERQKNWQVVPIIPSVLGKDKKTARKGASWVVAFYINKMGPIYRNVLIRSGYAEEVESVLRASEKEGEPVVPDEAERLLDQLALYGTPGDIKEGLESWYQAGATMPCLMTNPNLSLEEINFSVEALGKNK